MTRNKINFITGETYTLSELFSGERKIVIPDLQRDYCWGDSVHTNEKKELVTDFVNNLITLYETRSRSIKHEYTPHASNLNLGLIYGYESPANHIQLCDGQQRITTLFLFLGMLNKYSKKNIFRQYLISDFEYKHDDREPYLNYAIRESSLYFMSDLVCHFFITNDSKRPNYYVEKVKDITNSSTNNWYYNEYNLDSSIQSMIKALEIIEGALCNRSTEWIVGLGDFIIHRLTFMYYDMENRRNGEETFVVINTTGEPLSTTQNLKPLVMKAKINEEIKSMVIDCNDITLPQAWEIIENWFWQMRIEENGNDTADAGFTEFLRWVSILHYSIKEDSPKDYVKKILALDKYKFDYEEISFNEIYEYWCAVKRVFMSNERFTKNFLSPKEEDFEDVTSKMKALRQIDCFKLLPVIEYFKAHHCGWENRCALRIYQFVNNLSRLSNVSRAVNTLVEDAIKIANRCEDIVEVLDMESVSSTILTDEEKKKLQILNKIKENDEEREKVEEAFWKAQEHPILKGEILCLINWSIKGENFSLKSFQNYYEQFCRIFHEKINDLTRRSLMTFKLEKYPYYYKGLTFGSSFDEWKNIFQSNEGKIKEYLDKIKDISDEQLSQYQLELCNNFDEKDYNYYDIIKFEYLLEYCDKKRINRWDEEWKLCKSLWSKPFSIMNAKLLYQLGGNWKCNTLENGEQIKETNEWKVWYYVPEQDCVVLESSILGIAIYIVYRQNEDYCISVFKRNGNTKDELSFLSTYPDYFFSFIEKRYKLEKKCPIESCVEDIHKLIEYINNNISIN